MTLEEQRAQFASGRFLAVPLAGTIAWTAIGVAGFLLSVREAAWAVFAGTGMIFYLALFIARFTGEDLLGRTRKGNLFDRLFLLSIAMALTVYAIAIPFFLVEPTSLPMSVGILTGLMWIPFSWIIDHWVGLFHTTIRTVLILAVHYLFPERRFVVVPLVVVLVYLATFWILARRRRVGSPAVNAARTINPA